MHNQEKHIIIGVLNDVYADKRRRAIDIEYNGETIKMFSGIETVGRFLNAQFAYSKIQTDRTNGYTVEFVPLSPACLDN